MHRDPKTAYVLVVDDNAANGALYERVIRNVPMCYPKCFTSAASALEWAAANKPAVAIVDYRMPDIDGLDFIRRLREIPNRNAVPCIMLTGVNDDALRRQAMQLGVVEFLTKPVNVDLLLRVLDRLVVT